VTARRPKVKWVSLALGGALIFLACKILAFWDPRLTPSLVAALGRMERLFFCLGELSIAVAAIGALWRSPRARLLDLAEALAYVACGALLFAMRDPEGGGLFSSPALPSVLVAIGLAKLWAELRGRGNGREGGMDEKGEWTRRGNGREGRDRLNGRPEP
jgi:hypothetical protein